MKKILISFLIFLLMGVLVAYAEDIDIWLEDVEENIEEESEEYVGRIFMESEFLDGDILKISIGSADFLVPVLGIAFHLRYDNELLSFLKYEPGTFLEEGGDPFYMVKSDEDGKIIFGETLRRDDNYPLGGSKICDFYFQINQEDEYFFQFENGVVSNIDTVRQDIDKIYWEEFSTIREELGEVILDQSVDSISKADEYDRLVKFLKNKFMIVFLSACILGFFAVIFLKKYWKKRETSICQF